MFSFSKRATIQKLVGCARSFFGQPEPRLAPSTTSTAVGEEVLVPYIADYYFDQAAWFADQLPNCRRESVSNNDFRFGQRVSFIS